MRKFFPFSFKGKNFGAVILSTLIYTLIIVAASVLLGIIRTDGTVSVILNVLRQFILLYCVGGIVIAILNACDLIEKKD